MKKKKRSLLLDLPRVAIYGTAAVVLLVASALLLRNLLDGAVWTQVFAWVVAVLTILNPGALALAVPSWLSFAKIRGYAVRKAVPAEGVGIDTLNRCAAIAEARADHPIADCLRRYCGDVGISPDRYVETPGYGVSSRFSEQMIHAGNAEYMSKLNIEIPDVPGKIVHVALESRAVGYYNLFTPKEARSFHVKLTRAVAALCAAKIAVLVLIAVTGTAYLAFAALIESLALFAGVFMTRK